MGSISPAGILAACAVGATAICGAGMLTGVVQAPAGLTLSAYPTQATLDWPEAVRLAKQTSFGPTPPLVVHIVDTGVDGWLNEQFAARSSTYADLAALAVPRNYCAGKTGSDFSICNRDYFSATPVAMRFYANAVGEDDQLRQRVAWALSQLIVASNTQVHSTAGLATLNEIFLTGAFGNYRDLLKAATFTAVMGDYLNMADSNKSAPSENYARELMQLFSLGVNLLNPDGTVQVDAKGVPLPTYSSNDVREVARALTGWTYTRLPGVSATDGNALDYSKPMVPIASRYDAAAKTFLGRMVPANASQEASVDAVIDAAFGHANTAPYVSKFLIQHLVVSNPSPSYVGRIARVFADNGAGVRGDLKAVVRAILTDPEARGEAGVAGEGKVKEPVLMTLSLVRAIGAKTDGYVFTTRDTPIAQTPFQAPSVFNFYPSDYPLPMADNLVSPPSKLMTTATIMARHNLIYDWTIAADNRSEFKPYAFLDGATGTEFAWSDWEDLSVDLQLSRVNLLIFENTLTAAQRTAIRTAMMAVTDKSPDVQARKRAQVALYLGASSPFFQTDR
jgi:uncharacterized protein (DUF1800 family)